MSEMTDSKAVATDERLREAVAYITPAPMNHGAIMLTADKLREHAKIIEAALAELAELRAAAWQGMMCLEDYSQSRTDRWSIERHLARNLAAQQISDAIKSALPSGYSPIPTPPKEAENE